MIWFRVLNECVKQGPQNNKGETIDIEMRHARVPFRMPSTAMAVGFELNKLRNVRGIKGEPKMKANE